MPRMESSEESLVEDTSTAESSSRSCTRSCSEEPTGEGSEEASAGSQNDVFDVVHAVAASEVQDEDIPTNPMGIVGSPRAALKN